MWREVERKTGPEVCVRDAGHRDGVEEMPTRTDECRGKVESENSEQGTKNVDLSGTFETIQGRRIGRHAII